MGENVLPGMKISEPYIAHRCYRYKSG